MDHGIQPRRLMQASDYAVPLLRALHAPIFVLPDSPRLSHIAENLDAFPFGERGRVATTWATGPKPTRTAGFTHA